LEFVNQTGAVASLHPVNLLEPELRAVVVIKKTYALAFNGRLSPAEDPMPLVADQLVTDFGVFHGEIFFRKRGSDVCVLGTARFDRAVTRARLRVDVGRWGYELAVIGDRIWTRSAGELVPSAPAAFTEMPISYSRAFGGVAQIDGEDVPWPDNPIGRGYYETSEQALGKPLPNIFLSRATASLEWNSRIPVAGWGPYPMFWGLRAAPAVKYDKRTGEIVDISTELFNHAHPDLILPRLEAGSPVRVSGMRGAPVEFIIPTERPRVEIRLGAAGSEALGELDGVFAWIDAARVVVTWRARFRYAVREEEIRRATLTFAE
jgi:hypothetical protein